MSEGNGLDSTVPALLQQDALLMTEMLDRCSRETELVVRGCPVFSCVSTQSLLLLNVIPVCTFGRIKLLVLFLPQPHMTFIIAQLPPRCEYRRR